MYISPLKKMLVTLIEIRASMHDETNASAIKQLDEAIAFLQQCTESGSEDSNSHDKAIALIGKFLDKVPSIAALIKLLSG